MIRVGFLLNFPVEYKGGINYLKNLFYAVNKFHNDKVEIFLFVPTNLGNEYVTLFQEYARIIPTTIIKEKTLSWLLSKVFEKVFNFDPLTYLLLKKYKIQVISHSNYIFPGRSVKTINWIPDFQYLHYPWLFPKKELKYLARVHGNWIKKSDVIVVSSYDALNDLETKYDKYPGKNSKVLHFVSQPGKLQREVPSAMSKYTKDLYFYLPNQFWEHKNHLIVFKAVKRLNDKGVRAKLLTSGFMHDYRNKNAHVLNLQKYVEDNKLTENIVFLGLIPYQDVLMLIKMAVAVINPSFFEGWSSTVEEAKSMGQDIILSDIPVHREQNPALGHYFKPDDSLQLANIMEHLLVIKTGAMVGQRPEQTSIVNSDLMKRTEEFANTYVDILNDIIDH